MSASPTDSQRAAKAALISVVRELAGMDTATAAAHADNAGAVSLLRQCPRRARDEMGRALVAHAPALAADVKSVCAQSVATTPSPRWQPFPVHALGFHVGRFVSQVAAAIGCDDAMVALPALACLAGVIGNRRVVRLKKGWIEPAVVWAVPVARSGAGKTPAMAEPMRPLRRAEADAIEREREQRADYEANLQRWKDTPQKERGDRPVEPEPGPRLLVSDVTVEALVHRLSHSPGGLLVACDELAGWLRGFNQYRGGYGGDTQAYLSMHRAEPATVDRRTGDTLSVRRAAVSIVGTVQPEVLAACLRGEHMADGLAARLLYAMPPTKPTRWTDAEITDELRDEWTVLLGNLRTLPVPDEPVALPLTSDARALYIRWDNELRQRIANADNDAEAACLSKIEAYGARLALIVALANDAHATEVDVEAMAAGLELADWFGAEAARVYARMTESDKARERRELAELIDGKGGAVTERELSRGPRKYRAPGAATVALDDLVHAGIARWAEEPPSDRPQGGGHRVRWCVLRGGDTGDGDTWLGESSAQGGDTSCDESRNGRGSSPVAGGDTSCDDGNQVSPSPAKVKL